MILKASLYANAALLILALTFAAMWQYEVARKHKALSALGKAQVAAVIEANKHAAELQKVLDTLPKAEESIREVVRDNPAKCDRPAPVAKRLREAIRAANAAGAVPGNP